MNKIIITPIAVCAVLAAATVYGAGATSSRDVSLFVTITNSSGDYLYVTGNNDQRFPDNSFIFLSGYISGQFFHCSSYSSSVVADMIDVTPKASNGSLQVNTSLLSCTYNRPVQVIIMNCFANGQSFNSSIGNGSFTLDGTNYKYHANSNSSSANCTGTADQVNFDITKDGGIGYRQYVNK